MTEQVITWRENWTRSSPAVPRYLLFSNPAHKTKTGTASRWETTNSNPARQSNYLANQQEVFGFAVPFTSFRKLTLQKFWAKTILLSQTGMFWPFLMQF
jgi:hypothetical protein